MWLIRHVMCLVRSVDAMDEDEAEAYAAFRSLATSFRTWRANIAVVGAPEPVQVPPTAAEQGP